MSKVLQINVSANWGSTGKIADQIGNFAIDSGWDSYIAYRWNHCDSRSVLLKIGTRYGKYTHYLGSYLLDKDGLFSSGSTRKLIKYIEEIQPDIVHLHNIHDHWLNYRLLFEYLNTTSIQVVWTFHDFWAITGHCMHFASVGCELYKTGCHDCPMQKVHPKSLMDRSAENFALKKSLFTSNSNLTIVPVSEWVGEAVRESFLQDKRINVIPNGIDTNVFKPTDISEFGSLSHIKDHIKEKFVIMSVASQWKFDKGLDDYIAMSNTLKEDEIIVLVGMDQKQIETLPKGIIGVPRTNNASELAALYTFANVITIFSSAETFGLTVIEGNACGTPAVVYDNTAPPALITPETGFVVENHNYRMAYSAIQQIKSKGKQNYTEACISLAREKYNKDKCFEKYVELYEELLNGKQER